MDQMKRPVQSKTLWFNTLVLGLLPALTALESNFPALRETMGAWSYTVLTMVVAAVNVWLRLLTTQGIER